MIWPDEGGKVIIVEDCRPGQVATGQVATYLGDRERDDMPGLPNPCFCLQDGSLIWGCECWWARVEEAGPLDEMQRKLEDEKVFLRALLALLAEEDDEEGGDGPA